MAARFQACVGQIIIAYAAQVLFFVKLKHALEAHEHWCVSAADRGITPHACGRGGRAVAFHCASLCMHRGLIQCDSVCICVCIYMHECVCVFMCVGMRIVVFCVCVCSVFTDSTWCELAQKEGSPYLRLCVYGCEVK
jgi:hypothetical protein